MSESPHTPGPWLVSKDYDPLTLNLVHCVEVDGGHQICALPTDDCGSDARLIAAAPDLLAALIRLIKHTESLAEREGLPYPFECQLAQDAVAKARGGLL